MTAQELARQMAQFYREHPNSWTQKSFARDARGNAVSIDDQDSARWCMAGLAIKLSASVDAREDLSCLFGEAGTIVQWNDAPDRTIEQVIEKLESFS